MTKSVCFLLYNSEMKYSSPMGETTPTLPQNTHPPPRSPLPCPIHLGRPSPMTYSFEIHISRTNSGHVPSFQSSPTRAPTPVRLWPRLNPTNFHCPSPHPLCVLNFFLPQFKIPLFLLLFCPPENSLAKFLP